MEDQNPNTNEEEVIQEEVEQPSEPEAPTQPEEPEAPAEAEAEPPAEEPQPEPQQPSRRESLRIAKLVSKLKQAQQQPQRQQPGLDYSQALEADPETISRLEADRQQYGQSQYDQGHQLAQSNLFHTRLEIDAPKIEAKYPLLDKESDNFNPAVADAINTWYLATTGYDPQTNTVQNANVRYSDFVEGIMELVDATAGEKVARTSQNIARQAAATGLRPDGSSAKRMNLNQAPEAMSDEELDAVIGQAIPRNARGQFTKK